MQRQILFLDSDPVYVELVKDLAFTKDFLVLAASDGTTAQRLLEAHTIDLIISDVDTPVMHGISFHKHVREDRRFYGIPFVFLTGTTDPEILRYISSHPDVMLIRKRHVVSELLGLLSRETLSAAHAS